MRDTPGDAMLGLTFAKTLSESRIAHLGGIDQLHGTVNRRFAGKNLLDERSVRAKCARKKSERVGKRENFEVGVNRCFRGIAS
jgi:hypothetical protein